MIVREWRARVLAARERDYIDYFRRKVLPELGAIDGFLGASLLRAEQSGEIEIVVLTRWASMDAIRKFAGDEMEEAVVHPAAAAMLKSFDRLVRHYEVVVDTSPAMP
ncbi:MAG: antibiotic biosynthesis monooxygenase [Acidobacteriota bacterium]|nr:antibiotic biosynthesis monooxygenase [Acidobacteriota bacterium]